MLENWELDDITEEPNWERRQGTETEREGDDCSEKVEKWDKREVGLEGIAGVERERKLVAD